MKINIQIDEQQTFVLNLDNSPLKDNNITSINEFENFVTWLNSRVNVLRKLGELNTNIKKGTYNSNSRHKFTEQQKGEILQLYNKADMQGKKDLAIKYGFKDSGALSQFIYIYKRYGGDKNAPKTNNTNNITTLTLINPSGNYSGRYLNSKQEEDIFLKKYKDAKKQDDKIKLVKEYGLLNIYGLQQKHYRLRKSRGLI